MPSENCRTSPKSSNSEYCDSFVQNSGAHRFSLGKYYCFFFSRESVNGSGKWEFKRGCQC
ncbi:hypothetical protein V6Z12_A12G162200 [Gossypium hirsutum]